MNILKAAAAFAVIAVLSGCAKTATENKIPLPEHPRPDFERSDWVNLNGHWDFTFDKDLAEAGEYDKKILVPFGWGTPLSEVEDEGDEAYYSRDIRIPSSWKKKRVFVVVGAADWETTATLDGKELGSHQGGYTPFEFELTDAMKTGKDQKLEFRIDDKNADWHLRGKQGYGDVRGIWQTVYLEARGKHYITSVHFSPDIDSSRVAVTATMDSPAKKAELTLNFRNGGVSSVTVPFENGKAEAVVDIPDQHLWNLDDPYLYNVDATLSLKGKSVDKVSTYFGQRKISAEFVPGKKYKYIALNNQPLYLQLCLDQSYNPEGYYTFPSDEFMKHEIQLSKDLGLNGNRVHIKVEVPRKLYWADKLGLLIMADVPNYWGQPTEEARAEWEKCMREQVERDYNHPSIFAWVDFNETWGLFTKDGGRKYTQETAEWVDDMYHLTKSLDPTRLVEDNSACNNDHTETDINSWHGYNAAYNWERVIAGYDAKTYPGGKYNFKDGYLQTDAPMINSECGNVWGYRRSAGDCDYTYDYHEMMNAFHRHPKVGGWLYTEHHDVINEWNGYVKYDRSEKVDGLSDMVEDMTVKDFHTPYYITPGDYVCMEMPAGTFHTAVLYSSFMTSEDPGEMTLEMTFSGVDELGNRTEYFTKSVPVEFKPFDLQKVAEIEMNFPEHNGLFQLTYVLRNEKGKVLSRNYSNYVVETGKPRANMVAFAPDSYTSSQWSIKESSVLEGKKVDGFGSGYFEYEVELPAGKKPVEILMELGAKQLFGKDIENGDKIPGDFMLGQGTNDPCKVDNAYAMTDKVLFPSKVKVTVNGVDCGTYDLDDDPADARGVLSWYSQPQNRTLSEAGSYGQLIKVEIPDGTVKGRTMRIRLTVPESEATASSGGLAVYGPFFGRYPVGPTVVLK